jgi:hypothetical protein
MSELRINGYLRVKTVLELLLPYLKFKKVQAEAILRSTQLLCEKKFLRKLTGREKGQLVRSILIVQKENYASRHKKTEEELKKILGLVPVTT